MNISVYGCGYVGLVTAALLADTGNSVLAIDIDRKKIEQLKRSLIPIYEPGLKTIITRNIAAGRLKFTTDRVVGVHFGLLQFITVSTPSRADGSADLQSVYQVAEHIGEHLEQPAVIIDKSTVPVGTAVQVHQTIKNQLDKNGKAIHFAVVSNPEFLKEGNAIADFMKPDRIIIGSNDKWAITLMRELYEPFNRNHDRILVMDAHSAELTKYAANTMLANKISFINEIAAIAEKVGADIEMVRQGIGSDPRIGYHFIYAGCGYGGSCFPKDVLALNHTAKTHGLDLQLIPAATSVNNRQKNLLFDKAKCYFGDSIGHKHIALWGLAFKPNTDDLREAPSLSVLTLLWQQGVKTTVYDPQAMPAMRAQYPDEPLLHYAEQPMQACDNADALMILTEWREFKSPDFAQLIAMLNDKVIFDGRNLYDPDRMQALGFKYFAIGRGEQP